MTYLPTIIGAHAPPRTCASCSESHSGTVSMNGGTIAMMSSGIEKATANQNMNSSCLYALACASACRSTVSSL